MGKIISDHIEFIGKVKNKVSNEYDGKILYLMVSGSHLFGFESPDSDIDYRGCWQINTRKLLGYHRPKDFVEWKIMKERMTKDDVAEHDIYDKEVVLDELQKEIKLLVAGNCNHWEHLTAIPLLTSPEHAEILKLLDINNSMMGIYHSYRGMAYQNYKKFILGGKHTVKKYLYVLRGLMAGSWVVENKTIQPNIGILAEHYNSPVVKELIDLKKRGMEKDPVNKNLDKYNREVDGWFNYIDSLGKGLVSTELKVLQERDEVISDWLLKTRLRYLDGYSG